MRWLSFGSLAAVALVVGCGQPTSPPAAGDTIVPSLSKEPKWTAGKPADLEVRLEARNADNATRRLDFKGLPEDVNPVATVTFYEGDKTLNTVKVTLSHRC